LANSPGFRLHSIRHCSLSHWLRKQMRIHADSNDDETSERWAGQNQQRHSLSLSFELLRHFISHHSRIAPATQKIRSFGVARATRSERNARRCLPGNKAQAKHLCPATARPERVDRFLIYSPRCETTGRLLHKGRAAGTHPLDGEDLRALERVGIAERAGEFLNGRSEHQRGQLDLRLQ
jgi:hypothetical protein